MPLGYARARLGYEKMPFFEELKEFAKKLAEESGYLLVDEHFASKIFLLAKNKEAVKRMKIKKEEI